VRVTLAAIFTFAGMPVIWVYATMVGDYFVKASMLLWRFHSGRWKRVLTNEALAV
jgi:Na+-driven multidrug efflux pump